MSREITQTDVGRTEFVYGPPEYNHATHPTRTGATFQSEICCAMGIHHTCAVFFWKDVLFSGHRRLKPNGNQCDAHVVMSFHDVPA